MQIKNETGIICFDVETTGFDKDTDEILQISIIDGDGNVLLDSLVKPYVKESWEQAMAVNHITPEMVKNAPYPDELASKVRDIFNSANVWVSYNGKFDLGFLKRWGVNLGDDVIHEDVMLKFAEYYKEDDPKHPGEYKWKKLTEAAEHFNFAWDEAAHNSLGDVKATLYVNQKLDELDKQLKGEGIGL